MKIVELSGAHVDGLIDFFHLLPDGDLTFIKEDVTDRHACWPGSAVRWTGRKGIGVNALAPGYFASEMTDQFERDYVDSTIVPRTLTGRLGQSEELGAALIFLASDAGSYVTGITLPVDGGMLIT